jgi:hypothetical protein
MNLAALLLTATMALPAQSGQAPGAPADTERIQPSGEADRQQVSPDRRERMMGRRPHTVGFGGQLMVSNWGAGGGARMFFGERLGVNLNVSWYRHGRYTSNTNQGSTFATLPSFIYMLTKPDPDAEVDIRPYVGGGISYVSTSRPAAFTTGTTTLQRRSGTGAQAFGGVEMTFAEADWMTLSVEGVYYKLPVNFVNSNIVGGFNYFVAVHFYLR